MAISTFETLPSNQLRHWRPRPGDKWHLDEVFLTINGECHYLWRAVDQDGNVLDILVQRRRNKQAGIVNLWNITPRRFSFEEIWGCVSGENTGGCASAKPYIVLSLLHRRAIFCIKLTMPC